MSVSFFLGHGGQERVDEQPGPAPLASLHLSASAAPPSAPGTSLKPPPGPLSLKCRLRHLWSVSLASRGTRMGGVWELRIFLSRVTTRRSTPSLGRLLSQGVVSAFAESASSRRLSPFLRWRPSQGQARTLTWCWTRTGEGSWPSLPGAVHQAEGLSGVCTSSWDWPHWPQETWPFGRLLPEK